MTHDPSPDSAIEQERRRLARLRLLEVLDTEPEPLFDGLVRLAASICGTPISLVSLIDDKRQWFKANRGLEGTAETAREVAFCAHAIASSDVMEVGDATRDARFASNPLVLGDPEIRFYAGAPITMPEGERIGTLCVIDRQPRQLTADQKRSLTELAAVARDALLQREQLHYMRIASDESRFKAVLESAPLGIFQANETGDVFFTNPTWQRIFGLVDEQGFGKRWLDAVHPEDRDKVAQSWAHAADTKTPFDQEYRILKDGQLVHLRSRATVVRWGRPVQNGIVGIVADISDRKLAAEKVEEANRFLERAENIGGVGGWEVDLRSNTVKWTDQNRRIFDLPTDFQPGIDDHRRFFDPEALARIDVAAAEAVSAHRSWDVEAPMTTASGRAVWVRSIGRAEYENGRAVRLLGTLQDITGNRRMVNELRNVEERQKRALDASRLALWDLDLETGHLYLSENWSELMGGPSEALVTTFEALAAQVPDEDQQRIVDALSNALKGVAERYDVEHRVRRFDGSEIWIHSEGRVTRRDAAGRALHATGTNQDITGRKAAEAEIKRARDAAEAASQAKTDFLATMSHEIRTPLNGVLGIAKLLQRDPLDERQRKYVDLIDNSAQTLLALINDLLDLGKIEAGQVVLEHIPFGIESVLSELTELYTLRASEKSLLFRRSVAPEVPAWVAGDPNRLRQILSNLLSNALKFTSAGEVALTVELKETREGWARLAFAVRDTGIGIPAPVQQRLFSRFVQADSSTTRKFGGSGLGLAIVKQLSEMMGGRVSLSSTPGQGSVFSCEIPFEVVDAPVERTPVREQAAQVAAARPERLLIAEDNTTNQIVVQGMLALFGYGNVTIVGNGQEALDAVAQGAFDAILMDCHMPLLDGFAATEQLRASGCTLPIIAMTASATAADREKCLRVGMDDYLAKPLDVGGLEKTMDRWLGAADARAATPAVPPAAAAVAAQPTFEREAALRRLGNDEELLSMVIASFAAETPRALDILKQALRDGANEVVFRRLHTLSGSSSTVGAAAVHHEARAMEQEAAAGNLPAVAAKLPGLERLVQAFHDEAGAPAAQTPDP